MPDESWFSQAQENEIKAYRRKLIEKNEKIAELQADKKKTDALSRELHKAIKEKNEKIKELQTELEAWQSSMMAEQLDKLIKENKELEEKLENHREILFSIEMIVLQFANNPDDSFNQMLSVKKYINEEISPKFKEKMKEFRSIYNSLVYSAPENYPKHLERFKKLLDG